MRKMHVQRGNALLLATVLCGGPLSAQFPASRDARFEVSAWQDIEQPITEATINGVQVVFPADALPSIAFHSGGIISGSTGVHRYFAKVHVTSEGAFRIEAPGFAMTRIVADAPH